MFTIRICFIFQHIVDIKCCLSQCTFFLAYRNCKFGTFYSSESKIFFAKELCKSLAFRENNHLHMFNANWFRLLVPGKGCQVGWHRCFCAISRRTNRTNRWHLFWFIWVGRCCFCFQLLRKFPVHLITVWQQLLFLSRRLAEMMLFPILLFLASGVELHCCVLFLSLCRYFLGSFADKIRMFICRCI